MDKTTSQLEFDEGDDNRIYKIQAIRDSKIYAKESLEGYSLGLYYLIF